MDSSRQALVPLLENFLSSGRNSAKDNTALFRLLTDDYSKYGSDFEVNRGQSRKSYKGLFDYPSDGSLFNSRPMDSVEDLKAIYDLYKALGISRDGSRGFFYNCFYQGLFYRPGWAVEKSDWFLEVLKELKHFSAPRLRLKCQPVVAECQILFIEIILRRKMFDFDFTPEMSAAICTEQRLWMCVEETVLGLHPRDRIESEVYFAAKILKNKPILKVYEENFKNVLCRSFRGDQSLLRPLIDSYFESVNNIWPEEWITSLRKFCTSALQYGERDYQATIRKMAMASPSKVFTMYFDCCAKCYLSDEVIDHSIEHLDYETASHDTLSMLMKMDGEVEAKFLNAAPVSAVRQYILGCERDRMMSVFEEGIESRDRVSDILSTGEFLDEWLYNTDIDEGLRGFHENTDCRDNVDRLQRYIPSGILTIPQAIVNLVFEKRMSEDLKSWILNCVIRKTTIIIIKRKMAGE